MSPETIIKKFESDNLDSAITQFESKPLSLYQIIEKLPYLDTDPPYQRGEVWKNAYKKELIRSILRGIPINTIHLVEKSESSSHLRWVLDGKQRIETIKSFTQNKFDVDFTFGGQRYNIKWKDLCDPNHPCHPLETKLKEFSVNVVIWKSMSMEAQRDVFVIINYSKSLNNDEKLYCEHYLAQKFLKNIYQKSFSCLDKYLYKKIAEDFRFAGIRMVHALLSLCYGYDLNDTFETRETTTKRIKKSCELIEHLLIENKLDASMRWEQIQKIPILLNIVNELNMSIDWFTRMISEKNMLTKGKKFEHNLIVDFLFFFLKKYQDGILTNSYFQQNLAKFCEFGSKWVEHKNANPILKKGACNKAQVKHRLETMENIFNNLGFDIGVKNKNASSGQKLLAALNAEKTCPVTGLLLTDNNVQFDHVDPKSNSSVTKIIAISDIANQKKSDITKDMCKKLNDYQTEHSIIK